MFNIYVSQRGLESLACGVMLGAILYHDDHYPEFEQILGTRIGSTKSDRISANLADKYDAVFDIVPFEYCELELYRRIRFKLENLVFNLISGLGLKLKECQILLDSKLPNLTIGNVIKTTSVKEYPALHMTRVLIETERVKEVNKLSILYPLYRFQYNLGRINPTHVDLILRHQPSIVHRHNTIEIIANYMIDTVVNCRKLHSSYQSTFLSTKLPEWITSYFRESHNKEITYFKDLISKEKLSKIKYLNKTHVIDLYSANVTALNNIIPEDMNNWLYTNAPDDLKYEILL